MLVQGECSSWSELGRSWASSDTPDISGVNRKTRQKRDFLIM